MASPQPAAAQLHSSLKDTVQVTAWFLVATAGLAVAIRLLTRVWLVRRRGWDDLFLVISFV